VVDLSNNDIVIREYTGTDSIKDMTELLHRSYKVLADMGLNYLATYQSEKTTIERISKGVCFVAEYNNKIIGQICYYTKLDFPEVTLDSPWIGQFAVEPEFQECGIGGQIIEHVEKYATSLGDKSLALDTAEPAVHLIEWYKKLGYAFHSYLDWGITNYRSVIMMKEL